MELTRRSFLTGATLTGACVAAGLIGCSPKVDNEKPQGDATDGADANNAETAAGTHDPVETEECDLVVVGTGTAGLCAAAKAAQMGAKVILLEKNNMLGGSSGFAEGLGALNSYVHKADGVSFDTNEAFLRIQDYHHWGPDSKVLRTFLDNSGRTIDWLHDECGINFYSATVTAPTSYPSWHLLADADGNLTRVKGGLIDPMGEYVASLGVDTRLESPATGLIVDENDAVKGVYYENSGKEYAINAKNVILATGGWADSEECFDNFAHIEFSRVHNWGAAGRDGDGITWAQQLGAALHFPANIMYGSTQIPDASDFEDPAGWIFTWCPGLRVNENAERFFNEMFMADFSLAGNAVINEKKVFTVLDQAYIDTCCNVALPQGLESVGYITGEPFTEGPDAIAAAVEKGRIWKADTIEELAGMMGVDAAALQATIDQYNGFAADGVDPQFGCPAPGLVPVKTAPFYATVNNPAMFATVGGLKSNENMQVLKTDGTPIEGLYAIGGDNSTYCGPCYDVGVLSGSQQGWCATGAVLACEHIFG